MSRATRRKRRALERQIATDTVSVEPEKVEPVDEPNEPVEQEQEVPEADDELPPHISELVKTLNAGDVIVDLACGDEDGTLSVMDNCRSIADAAEQAAADYVVASGRFPDAEIVCVCYTSSSAFGPFTVNVSLVTEATELRGETS